MSVIFAPRPRFQGRVAGHVRRSRHGWQLG